MIISKKDTEIINDKIAEINIRTEYCFDEIHRMTKVDFGLDEIFIKEYELEHDNTIFDDVPKNILKQKYDEANNNAETIMNLKYKPVIERIKL